MTLIFGKLSDIFGRKPVMISGISVFLLGSLLAGFSTSMGMLIGFRLLQGIGAGAMQPMTLTLIGDLYTQAERPKAQSIISTVWAGAAVFGPVAGGVIVDYVSWGWVFWINIPIGLLTIGLFATCLHEQLSPLRAKIDYAGAVLFAISIVCFLFILTAAGLDTLTFVGLAAISIFTAILFVFQELRAPEPMISIALWKSRLVATSNAASFMGGMALVGLTTFLPLYVQGVMNHSPFIAGATLTSMIVGWTMALPITGRFFKIIGIRKTLRIGSPALPLGAAILLLLTPESSPFLAAAGSFAMGIGMGLLSLTSILLVQASVEQSMRGSATSSILFSRSFGNALGATVMGAILTLGITHFGGSDQADTLLHLLNKPTGLAVLAHDLNLRAVLDAALHWSFWGIVAVAALSAAASWLLPIAPDAGRRTV